MVKLVLVKTKIMNSNFRVNIFFRRKKKVCRKFPLKVVAYVPFLYNNKCLALLIKKWRENTLQS